MEKRGFDVTAPNATASKPRSGWRGSVARRNLPARSAARRHPAVIAALKETATRSRSSPAIGRQRPRPWHAKRASRKCIPVLTPNEKLEWIHRWRQSGKTVAMVGDGINDAPSLIAADVGLGMGARGSDAALAQADVILMHDRIENVPTALHLSRRARRIIRQNLIVSLGTVVVLVTFALAPENKTLPRCGWSRRQHRPRRFERPAAAPPQTWPQYLKRIISAAESSR